MRAVSALVLLLFLGVAQAADLEVKGGVTMVAQAVASGEDAALPDGRTGEVSMSCDLTVRAKLAEGVNGFLHLEASSGDGLDQHLGAENFVVVNYDAVGTSSAAPTEAWIDCELGRGLKLAFGCADLSTLFDTNRAASDETTQFLNGSFRRSAAVRFPDGNPVFARLLWGLQGSPISVTVGWAETDADWSEVFSDPYWFAELKFAPGGEQARTAARLYFWSAGGTYQAFSGGNIDRMSGWGISADFELAQGKILFGRLGFSDERTFEVASSVSAGVELSWERDTLGAAAAFHAVSEDYSDATAGDQADMTVIELYWKRRLADALEFTADAQLVWNYDFEQVDTPLALLGMRVQLSF